MKANYAELFENRARFTFLSQKWDKEKISPEGSHIYKMAKNRLLHISGGHQDDWGKKFLNNNRKGDAKQTTSMDIFNLFAKNKNDKAQAMLDAEEGKVKKWLEKTY